MHLLPPCSSEQKFNSGCGWPAFFDEIPGSLDRHVDITYGMKRVEITCANCGGHMGHVFENEVSTEQLGCCTCLCLLAFFLSWCAGARAGPHHLCCEGQCRLGDVWCCHSSQPLWCAKNDCNLADNEHDTWLVLRMLCWMDLQARAHCCAAGSRGMLSTDPLIAAAANCCCRASLPPPT